MSTIYYVEVGIGALSEGCYSTLEKAKQAVVSHYKHMSFLSPKDYTEEMRWVKLHDSHYWVHQDLADKPGQLSHVSQTPDGVMHDVCITELELDEPLDFV